MQCSSCSAAIAADARFCSRCGASVAAASTAQSDPLRSLLQSVLSPNIEIVRPLGRGGMGAVYLGREPALDREVAIKTLTMEASSAPEFRERFRREARIAAKLSHPNIVPLLTFGESRDVMYFVMGFVRGESLAERLARETAIGPDDARRLLAEMADALSYAHERGIVHRDIKPENVLIDDTTGRAVLTDFGIARVHGGTNLTEAGQLVGTPHYMSPEQARGAEVGSASDIYSLGVLGYRMLTGNLPVRADSLPSLVAQLASDKGPSIPPLPPDVPAILSDAIMRCLRRDPAERWTAAALRDALKTQSDVWEVPEQMLAYEGRAFYLIPVVGFALMLLTFELFLWEFVESSWRMAVMLFQFGAALGILMMGVGFAQGRELGLPVPVIASILLRHPRWYPGWVPRWARRPGDFFSRLPLPFRLIRIAATICYILAIPMLWILPFGIVGIQAGIDVGMLLHGFAWIMMTGMLFLLASILLADFALRRQGFTREERSRAISAQPLPKSAWSEPKFAAVLLPDREAREDGVDDSPSRVVQRIVSRARKLPAPIAAAILTAARGMGDAIASLDAEATRIAALLDPADVERVEKRLTALSAADTSEESEVRRLLLDQQRVYKDLAARADSLTRQRSAALARLRALDRAIASSSESTDVTEIEREVAAIRDVLGREAPAAATDEPTAIQSK